MFCHQVPRSSPAWSLEREGRSTTTTETPWTPGRFHLRLPVIGNRSMQELKSSRTLQRVHCILALSCVKKGDSSSAKSPCTNSCLLTWTSVYKSLNKANAHRRPASLWHRVSYFNKGPSHEKHTRTKGLDDSVRCIVRSSLGPHWWNYRSLFTLH